MSVLGDSASFEEDEDFNPETDTQTEFCVMIGCLVKCKVPECTGSKHCPYKAQQDTDEDDFHPGIHSRSRVLAMTLEEALKLQKELQDADAEFNRLTDKKDKASLLQHRESSPQGGESSKAR